MLSSYPVACPYAGCGWAGGLLPSVIRGGEGAEVASMQRAWFHCPRCQRDWEVRIDNDKLGDLRHFAPEPEAFLDLAQHALQGDQPVEEGGDGLLLRLGGGAGQVADRAHELHVAADAPPHPVDVLEALLGGQRGGLMRGP
jgi:hypothetical protein